MFQWKVAGRVVVGCCQAQTLSLTTSTNYMSNNLLPIENQRLPMQFRAPDDGRCVARNMLSIV
jgi:hypothetical protein